MIFQISIDLNIQDKDVQAIIDLDTGFIGFTELIEKQSREFYYAESPIEFKRALTEKLEPFLADKNNMNLKICRKSETMKEVRKVLMKDKT